MESEVEELTIFVSMCFSLAYLDTPPVLVDIYMHMLRFFMLATS
jgi:hypothetical protein